MRALPVLFTILLLSMYASYAQPCNCANAFDELRDYTEKNYAGFRDKIKMFADAAYAGHNDQTRAAARKINTTLHCVSLLDNWLLFFNDNHLYMHYTPDTAWFKKTVLENRKIGRDEIISLGRRLPSVPEGIYRKTDGSLTVAVVPEKTATRDYAAYIVDSKTPFLKKGDLHFELKKQYNGLYKVIWYSSNHVPYTDQLDFSNGNPIVWNGWEKETDAKADVPKIYKQSFVVFPEEREWPVFAKEINDSLLYFRIQSFSVKNLSAINAMLGDYREKLQTVSSLIIDIRGNNGGGDICYRGLKEYLYTQPVVTTGADFLATADNIAAYRRAVEEAGLPTDVAKEYLEDMDRAEAFKGGYYRTFPDVVDSAGTVHVLPRKVMILMDGKSASSAEQFLLEARQSKKVILAGQLSRGILDYANVCEYKMDAFGFSLLYPASRSRRIDKGEGIENKGIHPDIVIDFTREDWLHTAVKYLR